jgi:hypothetical protein
MTEVKKILFVDEVKCEDHALRIPLKSKTACSTMKTLTAFNRLAATDMSLITPKHFLSSSIYNEGRETFAGA